MHSRRVKPELPICCSKLSEPRLSSHPSHQTSQRGLCCSLDATQLTTFRVHFQAPDSPTTLSLFTSYFHLAFPSISKCQPSNAMFYIKPNVVSLPLLYSHRELHSQSHLTFSKTPCLQVLKATQSDQAKERPRHQIQHQIYFPVFHSIYHVF